jgi:hypothetical protein
MVFLFKNLFNKQGYLFNKGDFMADNLYDLKRKNTHLIFAIESLKTNLEQTYYSKSPIEIQGRQCRITELELEKDHALFQTSNSECLRCIHAISCITKCDKIN